MNAMLTTTALVAALVTTSTVGTALAQPGLAPMAAPAAPGEAPELKSPQVATLLAIAGSVAPVVMVAAGSATNNESLISGGLLASTVTPSLGHWYAGEALTTGMGIRALSTGTMFLGLMTALSSSCWDHSCQGADNGNGEEPGAALMIVGVAGYIGGTLYDVATAGDAARRYNRRNATQLAVTPTVLPAGGGAMAMGMGVSGSF